MHACTVAALLLTQAPLVLCITRILYEARMEAPLARAAAIAFKASYSDADLLHFVTNLECLEAQFDLYGVFGRNVSANLTRGGPAPLGAKQANLTEAVRPYVQEIALSEQVKHWVLPASGVSNRARLPDGAH